jgi:hypothetical protein
MDLATLSLAKSTYDAPIPISLENREPRGFAKVPQVYATGCMFRIVSVNPIRLFDQIPSFRKGADSAVRIFEPQAVLRLVALLKSFLRHFVTNAFVRPRGKPGQHKL